MVDDGKLFVDIIPDFSQLKKAAKGEKLVVPVEGSSRGGGRGRETLTEKKQTGVLGKIATGVAALLAPLAVLTQLRVITDILSVIFGFINLGVVKLLEFIVWIGGLFRKINEFFAGGFVELSRILGDLIRQGIEQVARIIGEKISQIPLLIGEKISQIPLLGGIMSGNSGVSGSGIAQAATNPIGTGVNWLMNQLRGQQNNSGSGGTNNVQVELFLRQNAATYFAYQIYQRYAGGRLR